MEPSVRALDNRTDTRSLWSRQLLYIRFLGRTIPGMAKSVVGVYRQRELCQPSLPYPLQPAACLSQLATGVPQTDGIRRCLRRSSNALGWGRTHIIARRDPEPWPSRLSAAVVSHRLALFSCSVRFGAPKTCKWPLAAASFLRNALPVEAKLAL